MMFIDVVTMNCVHPGEDAKYVRELEQGKETNGGVGVLRMDERSAV